MTRAAALRGDGGLRLKRAVESCIALEQRQISEFGYCHWMHPLREISVASVDFRSETVNTDPNAWMHPDLQRFYEHQERKQKTYRVLDENEKFLLTANPNSIEARKVRLDRDLDLMKSELAHLDARAMKAEFDRKNRGKDPWASRRLF